MQILYTVEILAKVLMVIAEKTFRDEEFAEPKKIIALAGHKVTVASSSSSNAIGKLGMIVKPDTTISAVVPSDYDAVVIAGGPGTPAYLWSNRPLLKAVKTICDKGGIVAAICLAPVVLAKAGLLRGKKCTVFPTADSLREMEIGGALLQRSHVVIDGKLVTADGPSAATAFGEAVLKLLPMA